PPAAAPSPGVEALAAEVPRFDVARVGARGMLVAAGRAAPHAEVMLFDGAQEIGRARADARGEWVILPVDALAAGTRELSLRARRPGSDLVAGRDVVLLVVPESAAQAGPRSAIPAGTAADAAPPGPLAVLLPAAGGTRGTEAPRLLQAPPLALPADGPGRRGGRLGLDIVDYEEGGEIRFAGSAPPGATVRLYAGREHLGDARADAAGRWQVTPEGQPEVGRHMLRVDQLGASGSVAARIEVPFQREGPAEEPREGTEQIVVQPGHNLWRIARRVYGRGTRYTLIYDANREQIRDPRRIFPGQVLALPGASAPAASSLSR
ncbi:MAG: LysM peptidoglycan-binding domain-containing protein, partial [Acetobacteraceae bacterium]|nr:LysM peptidoglycan-binding domain-containing protein [Acetobacteraceae bacterium]